MLIITVCEVLDMNRPYLPLSVVLSVDVCPGYSEDGGAKKGEVIPEHEFAAGPVCLDDENEFPPVSILRQ